MEPKKIPLTPVMRDQLMSQLDYYAPLTAVVEASGSRYFIGSDKVNITETPLSNGEVQVQISFPIDDNKNAADGRVQLTDSFTLSSDGRRVQSFDRKFKWNGQGSSSLWQKRESDFRRAGLPSGTQQQNFADHVFTTPLILKSIVGSGPAQQFMQESGEAVQQVLKDDQVRYFPKNPDSFATVEKLSDGYRVKLTWVSDHDEDSTNGRYLMEDQFLLTSDKKFKSHVRQWRTHPDSGPADPTQLAQLFGLGKPPRAKGQAFIEALLPVLFPSPAVAEAPVAAEKRTPVYIDPSPTPVTSTGGNTGKSVEVAGPRVQTVPPASGGSASSGGPAFAYSFSQAAKLERNTSRESAPIQITQAIKAYLKGQLERRGQVGTIKFNFDILFNKETGHVTKVVASLLGTETLGLESAELQNLLSGAAQRIHQTMRAENSLSSSTLKCPVTIIIN